MCICMYSKWDSKREFFLFPFPFPLVFAFLQSITMSCEKGEGKKGGENVEAHPGSPLLAQRITLMESDKNRKIQFFKCSSLSLFSF